MLFERLTTGACPFSIEASTTNFGETSLSLKSTAFSQEERNRADAARIFGNIFFIDITKLTIKMKKIQ
jgi:hypothetical protein